MDISRIPWQILPNRTKILDKWGYPTFFTTEKVVALSETGQPIEIVELGGGEMESGLRKLIVDTHNWKLREDAIKAQEAAKPVLYERIKNYVDLANVIQARAQLEEMSKELERKGHPGKPQEQAGTRLPS